MADSMCVRKFKRWFRVWNSTQKQWWSHVRHNHMSTALQEADMLSKGYKSSLV